MALDAIRCDLHDPSDKSFWKRFEDQWRSPYPACAWFKVHPYDANLVERYDSNGRYRGQDTWFTYEKYFDLNPLILEQGRQVREEEINKFTGYDRPSGSPVELRHRVLEYLFTQGRDDSDAANRVRQLLELNFFYSPPNDVERVLMDYLNSICVTGKRKALKFLGYKTTEKKWVEKEMRADEIVKAIGDDKLVRVSQDSLPISWNSTAYNALNVMPAQTIIKVWVEEEVEV